MVLLKRVAAEYERKTVQLAIVAIVAVRRKGRCKTQTESKRLSRAPAKTNGKD
jgi:hypothetical protein